VNSSWREIQRSGALTLLVRRDVGEVSRVLMYKFSLGVNDDMKENDERLGNDRFPRNLMSGV
jgi:hypothetical protein